MSLRKAGTFASAERQAKSSRCAVCKGVLVIYPTGGGVDRNDWYAACPEHRAAGTEPVTAVMLGNERMAQGVARSERKPEEHEFLRRAMWENT